MGYSLVFLITLLASSTERNDSFILFGVQPFKKPAWTSRSQTWSSPKSDVPMDRPPNLVGQAEFIAAIESLKREANPAGFDAAKSDEKQDEEKEVGYAIGKTRVKLPIDAPTGLDLTETLTGMVLVSAIYEQVAAETGIQLLDTIVEVCAGNGTFKESTMGMNLDETATILQAASMHAVEKGMTEIELELNRLFSGYYGKE